MPVEHNSSQDDHYSGDPTGYERFNEFDVDEGGFNAGQMSSAIFWQGIWPNYSKVTTNNWKNSVVLDRTAVHKFAALFDPKQLVVYYFCDDALVFTAKSPYVDAISRKQHFYLIISAQTHGLNVEYSMNIKRVRAYVLN